MEDQYDESKIITPEGVVLGLQTAAFASRTIATGVDFLIRGSVILLLSFIGFLFTYALDVGLGWIAATVSILAVFVLNIGYSVLFETFWNGRTPGKAVLGLRVVTSDGGPIQFRHAAIRGVIGIVEILASWGAIAAISIFISKKHQRLGDIAADTVVLREKSASSMPQPINFTLPPEAMGYVSSLNVWGLDAQEHILIRSYLSRAHGLTPEARNSFGWSLAGRIARRLRTQPPYWMPPDLFLVCVAAAHQQNSAKSRPSASI